MNINNPCYIQEDGVVYNADKTEIVAVIDPVDLVIPEGVTTIEHRLFAQCTTLRSVVIPSSIKKLTTTTFSGCRSLKQVTLSEGFEEIEGHVFMRCSNLERINIPESVVELSTRAFPKNEKLQIEWSSCFVKEDGVVYNADKTIIVWVDNPVNFVLPKGVIYFDFSGCTTLRTITFPQWMEVLECSKFWHCSALEQVTLPEGLKEIGHDMFLGCTKLSKINIPQSVTKIYYTAFDDCPRELWEKVWHIIEQRGITLVDWDYERDVEYIINIKEKVMDSKLEIIETIKGTKSLRFIERCTYDKSVVIPKGVEMIPRECFRSFGNLESVVIPEGVKMIVADAFRNCSSLKEISLPNTLIYIGSGAFDGCTALEEITLPDSLLTYFSKPIAEIKAIGGCIGAFIGCPNIKKVTLSTAFEPYIKLLTLPNTAELNYV